MENNQLYIGLDGDGIGREIERNMITDNVTELRSFGSKITKVIEDINSMVMDKGGDVIFFGGDSVLFRGYFDEDFIEKILKFFNENTKRTASVGIGSSPHEVFLALRLAKSYGGNQFVKYKQSF